MTRHPVLIAGVLLGGFAVLGSGLVALTHEATHERIAENERQALLDNLHALVPDATIDNAIDQDTVTVSAAELLGAPETTVFRGTRGGEPVAAVFASVAPDGYSGTIRLLVAVRADGTLGGVRVIAHRETPGLGDRMELERSDWILGFDNRSLSDPPPERWKVRRDGGVFDQFTGATITPRAIVRAVKRTLDYAERHWRELFPSPTRAGDTADAE